MEKSKGYKKTTYKEEPCPRCGSTMRIPEENTAVACWRCVATNNF
jgi:ribosomal protein S27AE